MKRTILLLTAFLCLFPLVQESRSQVLIVGDSTFCSVPWDELLPSWQVRPQVFPDCMERETVTCPPAEMVLIVPPAAWFEAKVGPDSIGSRMETLARRLSRCHPDAHIYFSTGLPSASPDINRKHQEMVSLLLAELAKGNLRWHRIDLYTPLTEKLDIAVSAYPTSPKTQAEVLARKLRSPIPYRQADDTFLSRGGLTEKGRRLVAKILKKNLKK